MILRFPHKFIPRDYQEEVLKACFIDRFKHVFWVLHRRAGKDKTCINILIGKACERVGTYLYLFPQLNQARRVIWKGLDGSGMRFLDHIPKEIIARTNSTDMSVELINGSIIQLGGSNNYDALMGTNPVGIIYSEFPLHNPLARQYLNPILVENGGWEILQGTPRGKNHAHQIFMLAQNDPGWFVRRLTIEDTRKSDGSPIVTKEQVEQERRNGVSDELIRQEYYCDFNVGIQGAFYTQEIDAAEREGRICHLEVNPNAPVFTFWDLGIADATSIWWMQPSEHGLNCIYYYEHTGVGIEHYLDKLQEVKKQLKFNKYQDHYAPHDVRQRDWLTARSRLALAREAGIHFQVAPNCGIEDGIQAVKSIMPKVKFHAEHCYHGLNCLKEYRRKYDELNKIYMSKPLHDWASHGADAFRMFAVVWRDLFTRPELNVPRQYQSGFL